MAEYFGLNGEPVQQSEWSEIFASKERFLARDNLTERGVEVSTVWIGISWLDENPPLIFETMVFPLDPEYRWQDLGCWRWATRDEALDGHRDILDGIMSDTLELRPIEFSDDELM